MTSDRTGVDRAGRSPLHYAALDANIAEVQRLLEGGADPNLQDDNGFAPLHFATQSRSLDVCDALLRAGAVVDAVDRNGNTPLSNAVFYAAGAYTTIARLLQAGANPDRPNLHGVSPVALARTMADPRLASCFDPSE